MKTKKERFVTLPVTLTNAIAYYYAGCECQQNQIWDQESDVNRVKNVAGKLNIVCIVTNTGSFSFKREGEKSVIIVDQTTFPRGLRGSRH